MHFNNSMKYLDANNNPINPGFYLETFLKGKDEFRNRVVYIGPRDHSSPRLFSIMNRANMAPLNPNYSRWLRPFDEEIEAIGLGMPSSNSPSLKDHSACMDYDGDSTPNPRVL